MCSTETATQISATRFAIADAKAADQPLDALALLVEQPSVDAMTRANPIVARLVESPSMLVDAGVDLDRWIEATPYDDALRTSATAKRKEAFAGRQQAEAAGVTSAQLATMAKRRPWDQYVQLRIARLEADAGKRDVAAARLGELGPPGLVVREARQLLTQLTSAPAKRD